MIPSKCECTNGETSGNLTDGQLLCDIEAISKALYLHKTTQNASIIPSKISHQFAGNVRFPDYGLVLKPKCDRENILNKISRSSSSWNWKKPLKALSHLRDRKLSCSFFLHVHSIDRLPASFNGYSLSVQFGRKNEVIMTRKSQVLKGMADFDETLMHRCTVHCHRSGTENSCKYEPKIFLIQVSVVGSRGLDIGKHWFDLTQLLPLTLEELEGESSGKWTTTFKLSGEAKGAILNVSFGYLLTTDGLLESSGNMTVSQLIDYACRSNVKQNGSSIAWFNSSGRLSRSGSVPSNLNEGSVPLPQLVDGKTCHEVLVPPASELSKSIHLLYRKLDEGDLNDSIGSEECTDHDADLVKQTEADDDHEIEYEIIERGVELEVPEKKETGFAQRNVPAHDISGSEMVQGEKIFTGDNIRCDDKVTYSSESLKFGHKERVGLDNNNNEKQSECARKLAGDELLSDSMELLKLESSGLTFHSVAKDCDRSDYIEVQSSYRAKKMAKRSLSIDDVSESVAMDFLIMLDNDHLLLGCNSDNDPESPRERLLREFEMESLISGNFLLSPDESVEDIECAGAPVECDYGDDSEDHMLASLLEAAEEELGMTSHSLRHRRKAMMLEDLETEALMRDWGIDEKTFQNSPRNHSSSGFGSPIELAPEEEPVKSPALREGFGPLVWTEGTFL